MRYSGVIPGSAAQWTLGGYKPAKVFVLCGRCSRLGGRQTRSDIFFSFEFVLPESPSHPNPDGGPKLAAGRNEKSLAAAVVIVQNDRAVLAW